MRLQILHGIKYSILSFQSCMKHHNNAQLKIHFSQCALIQGGNIKSNSTCSMQHKKYELYLINLFMHNNLITCNVQGRTTIFLIKHTHIFFMKCSRQLLLKAPIYKRDNSHKLILFQNTSFHEQTLYKEVMETYKHIITILARHIISPLVVSRYHHF